MPFVTLRNWLNPIIQENLAYPTRPKDQAQWQLPLDIAGMWLVQTSLVVLTTTHGRSQWQYLLLWLILKRTIGVGIQAHDHLKHYGLWGNQGQHLVTQRYT